VRGRSTNAESDQLDALALLELAAIEPKVLRVHRVSFRGPPLDRRSRAALAAARIRLIQRLPVPAWCGQLQDYLVEIHAESCEDAIARASSVAIEMGPYDQFVAIGDA